MSVITDVVNFFKGNFVDPATGNTRMGGFALGAGGAIAGWMLGNSAGGRKGSTMGGIIGAVVGAVGGSSLMSLFDRLTGNTPLPERFTRQMPVPVMTQQQQVTEQFQIQGPAIQQPGVQQPGNFTLNGQNPNPGNAVVAPVAVVETARQLAPILSRLTPPPQNLGAVIESRQTLQNNIHTLETREQFQTAAANLAATELSANQFMVNMAQFVTDRNAYHAPDGERGRLVGIVTSWSQQAGRHPLTQSLANTFVPTLPSVEDIDATITVGATTYTAPQAITHFQNGTGPWAIPAGLRSYGELQYNADAAGINNPQGSRMAWAQLSTNQKILFTQRKLVESYNVMGNGACRLLPAYLSNGRNNVAIPLDSIFTHANAAEVARVKRLMINNQDYGGSSLRPEAMFATYTKAAYEVARDPAAQGGWRVLASIAGQAKARFANGGNLFGSFKDPVKAQQYADIETYANRMAELETLNQEMKTTLRAQAVIYELYENMSANRMVPARRQAMAFLNQRMPLLQQSGIAVLGVSRRSGATQCPQGVAEGIALTFVDTRRPGNLVTTVFGTMQGNNFVVTHSFEGIPTTFDNAAEATTFYNGCRLTSRPQGANITMNGAVITQLLPAAANAEAAALTPCSDGRTVAVHLGEAFNNMPVHSRDGRWMNRENTWRIIEAGEWTPDVDGPLPTGLPNGVTAENCTGVTFVDPDRGGRTYTAFGYRRGNQFFFTHCWEGSTKNPLGNDGQPLTWEQRLIQPAPAPLAMNGDSFSATPAQLNAIPAFLRNRTWEVPPAAPRVGAMNMPAPPLGQQPDFLTAATNAMQPASGMITMANDNHQPTGLSTIAPFPATRIPVIPAELRMAVA